ncbi:hypothetical protein GCM10008957_55080 [Deinococcus ruber]|uniref:Uncharacterized protein n=1 Tax=Deinococcus ruber TaxID=1848197 RepID=A0A918FJJ7_9DEIO|nr:hypothetical protein GCM10008957_55080 [Deinococcus ruber]
MNRLADGTLHKKLLVEDSFAKKVRRKEGFEAVVKQLHFSRGEEALASTRRDGTEHGAAPHPTWLLLDLLLPSLQAFAVLVTRPSKPTGQSLPILVLSCAQTGQHRPGEWRRPSLSKPYPLQGGVDFVRLMAPFWLIAARVPKAG